LSGLRRESGHRCQRWGIATTGNTKHRQGTQSSSGATFTSALFGNPDEVSLDASAEMLAVLNLPPEAVSPANVSAAAQILLRQDEALEPLEVVPSLVNADVAQPAGLLDLADVAVVLTTARAEGQTSKENVAQQVSQILDAPGAIAPFDALDVRVVPGQEQLGDPGQPGGEAIATSESNTVISQVVDTINNLPVAIAPNGSVSFPAGTEIPFPAPPARERTLQVSSNQSLTPASRTSEVVATFSADELGCVGLTCRLGAPLEIIPAGLDLVPGDYELTYTFRYSDGGSGFIEESAVRVLSVLREDSAPTPAPPPPPTLPPVPALVVNSFDDDLTDDEFVTLREAIATFTRARSLLPYP
ncbi:MAG: hypothetical protein AAFY15_14315, partial [Cyanobacteria bacterium J06648_11]